MSSSRAIALTALVTLAASSGCASQIGFGRARTLEPGRQQVSGLMEVDAVTIPTDDNKPVPLPWFQLGVGYRRGLASGFDLGARAWGFGVPGHLSFGGALDAKVQLVRSPFADRGADAATGLTLGYQQVQVGGAPWHVFGAGVPLLMGVNFGKNQFVVGPRAGGFVWTGYGMDTIVVPFFGGSTGVSVEVARKTQLMPEIVVTYVPVSFNGELDRDRRYGSYQVQLGLTVSYEP